jgi:hypothetical protein
MKTKFKESTLAYALLLATSPAWGAPNKSGNSAPSSNTDEGDKSNSVTEKKEPPKNPFANKTANGLPIVPKKQNESDNFANKKRIEIDSITIDPAYSEQKVKAVTQCSPVKVYLKAPRRQPLLSLSFNPNKKEVLRLQFTMLDIPVIEEKQLLLLLYSRCLSNKPKIKTTDSLHKLRLDTKDLEILGTYEIPPQKKSGKLPATFDIDLDTDKLKRQVEAGNDTFYFQGALIKESEFNSGKYDNMLLSSLEAIHTTLKFCPTDKQFASAINSDNTSCALLPSKN